MPQGQGTYNNTLTFTKETNVTYSAAHVHSEVPLSAHMWAPYLCVASVFSLCPKTGSFSSSPFSVSANKSPQGCTTSSAPRCSPSAVSMQPVFSVPHPVKGPFTSDLWLLWQYTALKYLRAFFTVCF